VNQNSTLDVVVLYAPPWDGPTRFSKHHLASYLARRGARVLYVEAPLTPLGVRRRGFARELRQSLSKPHRVEDRLWVRRYFLPVPYHAATRLTSQREVNRVGQRLLSPLLRRDFRRMQIRNPILIAGLPHVADLAPQLEKRLLVYHCADDFAHVRGFPTSLACLEADLCRQADLVITTSETLCQSRRQWNPQTYWIPNAADVEHFARRAQPAPDLHKIPRPVVGFVGGLSEWVDLDLVACLARQRPEWSFVLVGPIGIDAASVQALHNVRLIGPRAYADLPSYLAAMDVALIPFKHNEVTYNADPIKAYEYLAAGVPVVATDLPALRRLNHVVRLASDADHFQSEVASAIAEGREARRAERQAEAARHTWSSRFDRFWTLLQERLACAS
jgi:glycosyltransferase involved in cell wall biosynthesis